MRTSSAALARAGKTTPEIAQILGRSKGTVSKHIEHVFQKLAVETRIAAVGAYMGARTGARQSGIRRSRPDCAGYSSRCKAGNP